MKIIQSDISVAILAGGKNSRMKGDNKALLKVDGISIIDRQIEVLSEIFGEIFIVGKDFKHGRNLRVVEDIFPEKGPLSGIHTALSYSNTELVFVVSCDMPFLCGDFIKELVFEATEYQYDAIVPKHKSGIEPLHAIYRKSIVNIAEATLKQEDIRIRNMFDDIKIKYFDVNLHYNTEMIFFNINNPQDLEKAQHYAKGIK
ncbi:MAG: molybdenum cofactor guanylyltransferase [Bacteroidetes bacterium]|nr:molybdenum cofactor guanylyltransferase [Bacteroidota bacterium]